VCYKLHQLSRDIGGSSHNRIVVLRLLRS